MNGMILNISIQKLDSQFGRFLVAGSINTLVGLGIIFSLMLIGISPYLSNICGYAVGLTVSFALNRNWVFAAYNASLKWQIVRFLFMFMIAFGVNFLILIMLLSASVNAWLAQILASACYTLVFYVLNKRVVFS